MQQSEMRADGHWRVAQTLTAKTNLGAGGWPGRNGLRRIWVAGGPGATAQDESGCPTLGLEGWGF
jgi:hypothetical protein